MTHCTAFSQYIRRNEIHFVLIPNIMQCPGSFVEITDAYALCVSFLAAERARADTGPQLGKFHSKRRDVVVANSLLWRIQDV